MIVNIAVCAESDDESLSVATRTLPTYEYVTLLLLASKDVTKFRFKFDNVRTSNIFNRFKIRGLF